MIETHSTQHSNTTTTTANAIPTNTPTSPVGVLGLPLGGNGVANNCVMVVWRCDNVVVVVDNVNVPWGTNVTVSVELAVPWGVNVVDAAGVGWDGVVDTGVMTRGGTELEVTAGVAVIFLDSPQVVPKSFTAHTMKLYVWPISVSCTKVYSQWLISPPALTLQLRSAAESVTL